MSLKIVVPLVPPSVNHYWKRSIHGGCYVTPEGRAYKEAVSLIAQGHSVEAKRYEIEATIYLPKGKKGDGDNFWKAIADGLVYAGVIHSDSAVDDWILHKRRDAKNPRTEIVVRGLGRP